MNGLDLILIALATLKCIAALILQWRTGVNADTGLLRNGWRVTAVLTGAAAVVLVALMLGGSLADDPVTARAIAVLAYVGATWCAIVSMLANRTILRLKRIEALEADVIRDPLTGLYNRRFLDLRLSQEVSRAHRGGSDLCVIMADIDHFKQVNDRYGHPGGDAVLRSTADILKDTVRASDLVARFGGEEFAILLPDTGLLQARQLAERLRTRIGAARTNLGRDTALTVTSSFGVAQLRPDDDAASLLAEADDSLYRAKNAGRNRVHWNERQAA